MESGVLGRIKNFALLRIKRFALRHNDVFGADTIILNKAFSFILPPSTSKFFILIIV